MNLNDLEYEKIDMETGEIKEPELNVVANIAIKPKVEYNKDELEMNLSRVEKMYNGIVFQEDQIQEAKKERAKLNTLSKKLAESRKEIIKEATAEIKPFENFMKLAEKRAKAIAATIDEQIKVFEEKQAKIRLEIAKNYLNKIVTENEKYKEFIDQIDLEEKVFNIKTSYTKTWVGNKIKEYVEEKLRQADEILEAREVQARLLQEKIKLISNCCERFTKNYNLKIKLNPNNFEYLKNYDLTEILNKIEVAAKEQQEEEIKVEEEVTVLEPQKIVKEVMKEKKYEKVYNFSLKIANCSLEKSKILKEFLIENNFEFSTENK